MSIHPEGTLGRLRYALGGDRPSQTTRLALSALRFHGVDLRCNALQEWYFTAASLPATTESSPAPTYPTHAPHRLRPGCSKAPRGLFVLSWETRIFTGTSISPSPLLRQRSSRYSLRAGRNLPDKEFRYLRTVIVTAAVHRGFASSLRSRVRLTFRHWAGVSPYTSACALAETCVFGKQSLEPIVLQPSHPSALANTEATRAPLLPKVRGQFAEFLNRGSLVHLGSVLPAYQCRCAVRAEHGLASGFSGRPGGP